MPRPIKVGRILTIGFVKAGDDPKAEIVLLKRKNGEEEEVMETPEQKLSGLTKLVKAMGALLGAGADGDVEEVEAPEEEEVLEMAEFKREDLPQEAQDLLKGLEEKNEDLEIELAKRPPAPIEEIEEKPEEIPEAVAKALQDAEARAKAAEDRLTKMEGEKQLAIYQGKALALKNLPEVTVDDFGGILMKAAGALDAEEFERLEKVLNGADTLIAQGELLKEIGGGGSGYGTKQAEVDGLVAEKQKAHPEMSKEDAELAVYKDQPLLLQAVLAETSKGPKG